MSQFICYKHVWLNHPEMPGVNELNNTSSLDSLG